MSVIIRGMDLPKSCSSCPICYDDEECPVSDLRFWRGRPENNEFSFIAERHPRCPLEEEKDDKSCGEQNE